LARGGDEDAGNQGAEEEHAPLRAVRLLPVDLGSETDLAPHLRTRFKGVLATPDRKSPHA
jgi:hypothetical protein